MNYQIKYINLEMLAKYKYKLITTEECYNLLKLKWKTLNNNQIKHKDLLEFQKHYKELGPVYVKTNKCYLLKINLKRINNLSSEEYENNKCLVVPPLDDLTRESIGVLQTILLEDSKIVFGPNFPKCLKFIYNLKLKRGTLRKQLQSGKSYIRRFILTPKVQAMRAQIMQDAKLKPHQCICPIFFAKYFNIVDFKLVDPHSSEPYYDQNSFYILPTSLSIIAKRDPSLHIASANVITEIAFSQHDLLYIPGSIMKHKNADCDGDAFGLYTMHGDILKMENKLFLSTEYNILIPTLNSRLVLSEVHILYLYKRGFPVNHKFASAYNNIKKLIIKCYKENNIYMKTFHNLKIILPKCTLDDIEPTNVIFAYFILYIATCYGSEVCFQLFCEINTAVYELSIGLHNEWYRPNLPSIYMVSDKLTCTTIKSIFFSGAKGTLEQYYFMLKKKKNLDNSFFFSKCLKLNGLLNFKEIYETLTQMSNSSDEVPKLGYQAYKSANEWNPLQIINNQILYNNKSIGEVSSFFQHLQFFPPEIIHQILLSIDANYLNV